MQHLDSNYETRIKQSPTDYLKMPLLRDKKHSLFIAKMSWRIHCPLKEVEAELLPPLTILYDRFH